MWGFFLDLQVENMAFGGIQVQQVSLNEGINF